MTDLLTWDEEKLLYEARLDRDVERIMAQAPRCPIHGSHHVAGVGIGNEFFCYGTGICPSCFWEYRRAHVL